jgi:hypothetical protein
MRNFLLSWEPVLFADNKRRYRKHINDSFRFVGLMLSRKCEANCIFCPIPHKANLANKEAYMSMDMLKKVVDELAEHGFSGQINYGENGDALLNPNFKDIVKYVYEKVPLAKTILYTNMMHVDSEISELLLKNGLSELILNVDGSSSYVYNRAKPGLNFDVVRTNLHNFLDIRDSLKASCKVGIGILPPRRYLELASKQAKKFNILYDVVEIIEYWQPYLSGGDWLSEFICFFKWNTARSANIRRRSCPPVILKEFFEKLFVSSEGDTYVCCMDYYTSSALTYGNAMKNSIYDLWQSKRRKDIIKNIVSRQFEEIGEPCLHCNEKFDYLRSYINFVKHRYFSNRRDGR